MSRSYLHSRRSSITLDCAPARTRRHCADVFCDDVRGAATTAFLTSALRGRRRVLEVGCGRGGVARALGAAGFDVTAIDIDLDPTLERAGEAGQRCVRFARADF